jgi:hypothetical protein
MEKDISSPIVNETIGGKLAPGARVQVTSRNHVWAAKATGLDLIEIQRLYNVARVKGVVCTVIVK